MTGRWDAALGALLEGGIISSTEGKKDYYMNANISEEGGHPGEGHTFRGSAALAAADSFTIYAYRSAEANQVHWNPQNFVINARHGRFWVGSPQPTTYCPDYSGSTCPSGNYTVVDDLFRNLQISKPGGQMVYADPDGVISYTPGGDSSITAAPPGSNLYAFRKSSVEIPSVFGEDARLLRFYKFGEDQVYSNIYVCPHAKDCGRAYLRARWTSKQDAVWDSQCVGLDGLLLLPSDEKMGAYEYTRA
ncbi:hypothetical protein LX36DRAFT_672610 [Colletotrichum falcatum]|nr:hypothetical protein LX36DRAFT_672610 [Colletotrichum falcatum]